jgi:hypothetical protein
MLQQRLVTSRALVLCLAGLAAACGSSDTMTEDECGPNLPGCPSGFMCDPVLMRCVRSTSAPDAAVDAATAADAPLSTPDAGGADAAAPDAAAPLAASLEIAPASFAFGSVDVGGASPAMAFTVRNAGGMPSGAPSVTLTDETSYGVVSNGCSAALGPGGTCSVSVRFTPQGQAGARAAQLRVTASPGGTANASLSGTATGMATFTLTPLTFSFGEVPVGQDSVERVFVLENEGTASAATPAIAVAGGAYRISSNTCPATLAVGADCAIGVTFRPAAVGAAPAGTLSVGTLEADLSGTGTVQVTVSVEGLGHGLVSSQPAGISCPGTCTATFSTATVILVAAPDDDSAAPTWSDGGCSGLECEISLEEAPRTLTVTFPLAPPDLTFFPNSASFGAVTLNGTSSPETLTLSNSGGPTGAISTYVTDSEFDIVSDACNGATLAMGEMCSISVVFGPIGSPGDRSGNLIVNVEGLDGFSGFLTGTAVCVPANGACEEHANCCERLFCNMEVGECQSGVD